MTRFIDDYDCAMFDLDGVVYLGPEPVVGAPESIADLRQLGVRVGFVTNNAGRSPEVVVAHLNGLGIECHQEDVVTSAQAIAQLMARELPSGAKVLVCGAQALVDEVTAVLEPGALEARHVRFFTAAWWHGYAPRPAEEFAACLAAARVNRLADDADWRTPWERGDDAALAQYELDMIRRSAANMRALGIL